MREKIETRWIFQENKKKRQNQMFSWVSPRTIYMANLKLFFDFLSPPSRSLYILFEKCQIPCEKIPVKLREGDLWLNIH